VAAGCGTAEQSELEAQQLVPQLSDLPAGYDAVPAESFPVATEKILHDQPWSAGAAGLIRRERIAGYQTSFVAPSQTRLECSAALYRTTDAAKKIYSLQTRAFAAFLGRIAGRALASPGIGEESTAHRFSLGGVPYYGVVWRFRNVLSSCTAVVREPDPEEMLVVARAQQARIARALDEGRR
jgi:hypothetical protein